jgi:hypothetical protein
MSIATDITRIIKAKADIKTAIEEKGIEVGDGLIDTYAGKIAEIPAGDGDDYRIALWDGIQNYGARTDYSNAFRYWKNAHNYWKPIYNINHNSGSMVFYFFESDLGLPELCEIAGVNMDWSGVKTFAQTFSYANIPDVGVIDTRNANSLSSIFAQSMVQKAHLILKDDGSQYANTGAFSGATKLTDLTIEGAIGSGDFPIPSPLTPESMISVITHLVNYSGTDKEYAYKLSFNNACWEALEAHSKAHDGGKWKDYVSTVLCWNV